MKATPFSAAILGAAILFTGCTNMDSPRSSGHASAFAGSARITNRFLPFGKGGRWIYEGSDAGKAQLIEIAVSPTERTIEWHGDAVESAVVRRRQWVNGLLIEQSHDYYAQKNDGSVWAMGEQVDNYKGPKLVDHAGTWLAGADGAAPALVMPGGGRVDSPPITEDVIDLAEAGRYQVLSRHESTTTPSGAVDDGLLLGASEKDVPTKNLFVPGIGAVFSKSGSAEVRLVDRLPQDVESAATVGFSHPTVVDNPWFGFDGVAYRLYLGRDEGEPLRVEVAPTGGSKVVSWQGGETETAVSQFVSTSERKLLEIALDWFAQDDAGNVWYFGEDVRNYERGSVANKQGSWIAGVDGPPGMIMPGDPEIGQRFNPENIPGTVFETVDVRSVDKSYRLGSGRRLHDVLQLHEALDDGSEEFKLYATGYGEIHAESPGTEVADLVYALPNDAIAAHRPLAVDAALRELRTMSLHGSANMIVIRDALAVLTARHDPVPPVLFRLARKQLTSLERAVARSRANGVRMHALDMEQTLLDIARLYRGRGSVDLDFVELNARRLLAAAQAGNRSTAGSAAALAHASAVRNKEAVGERVLRMAAAADAATPSSGLKQIIEAATDLLAATRAQRASH